MMGLFRAPVCSGIGPLGIFGSTGVPCFGRTMALLFSLSGTVRQRLLRQWRSLVEFSEFLWQLLDGWKRSQRAAGIRAGMAATQQIDPQIDNIMFETSEGQVEALPKLALEAAGIKTYAIKSLLRVWGYEHWHPATPWRSRCNCLYCRDDWLLPRRVGLSCIYKKGVSDRRHEWATTSRKFCIRINKKSVVAIVT